MRTTLKRGIGQAGGHNGNGHSAAQPLFGPIVRYTQPPPPRRSVTGLIMRGFGWLVLAAAVIGSGAAGGFYLYGHESLAQVVNPRVLKPVTNHLAYVQPGQPAIALVAGYDVRGKSSGANPYAGSNSDTLMLLRADPKNNTLSLLSFPRDLWVSIYCHGATPYTQSRINSAWSLCGNNGPAATLNTIHRLTGLNINYFITLDFHAFKQLVNQLHGVYINVDRRYYNPLHTGYSAINLHPGYQKLTGGAALSYVRYRHTDSDVYRTGRQQLFIEALKSRLRTSLTISNFFYRLPAIIGVLKHNIEVASASGQKVGLGTLKSYLGLLYNLPPGHLVRNQIPIGDLTNTVIGGADVLTASPGAVHAAVQRFLHPVVPPAAAGGHKKTGPKKKVPKLPKSQISTLVLNAGRVAGEAANTSYLLETQGCTVKKLPASVQANAPKVTSDTTVYFDPVQASAQQAALQLRPLFGSHTHVQQMNTQIADIAQQAGNPLTVIAVGTSFGGKLVVHHRVNLPAQPQQPAQLTDGAGIAAPALRHVYDEVHFPLMVPHKIAQGASLSTSEGVRGFKPIGHQHEAVLTFVQPDGIEYWQVEESTWNSAPILANPSYTFVHRGQKFAVYTTGGAIQMVALRTQQATYWVVNTILNELSNKTMLGIAESFRPLRR